MSILIDYNQIGISYYMHQAYSDKELVLNANLFRHLMFSAIIYYRSRFRRRFGEIVICTDHKDYWRRGVFPHYKSGRKKKRDQSTHDWPTIFNLLEQTKCELRENIHYKVMEVEEAEADDIIAVLAKHEASNNQKTLIVSSDKDFLQLQIYPTVEQFSPAAKGLITTDNPEDTLRRHILAGDDGDGIPNFLSPDIVFVTEGMRQSSLYKKRIETCLAGEPEEFCQSEEELANFKRNQRLIDFNYIPTYIQERIVDEFVNVKPMGKRSNLFPYFVKHKMKNLLAEIDKF